MQTIRTVFIALAVVILVHILWDTPVDAQFAGVAPIGKPQYFSNTGAPLAGGCLATYAAGTTSFLATYQDSGQVTPNADPITLDSSGRPPAGIFLGSSSYKFTLTAAPASGPCSTTNLGSPLWTVDGVSVPGIAPVNIIVASGQSLTMQAGSTANIGTSWVPSASSAYNLGSSGAYWNQAYITQGTLTTGNIGTLNVTTGPSTLTGNLVMANGNMFAGLTTSDLVVLPGTIITQGGLDVVSGSANASIAGMGVTGSYAYIASGRSGSGTYLPLQFFTNGASQMTLDTSGNLTLAGTRQVNAGQFTAGNASAASTFEGGATIFGTTSIGITGTGNGTLAFASGSHITPPSGAVLDGAQTCAASTHIATLTVSQGLVTGITCN